MTTAPTPSRADALIREHRASMHPETLRAWASDAVDELRRLQAENERLQQLLQCDTPRYCSSVQRCTAGDERRAELEARKPLPLSDDDRLRLRSDVARAIWDVMREHEDRCDHALEDVDPRHQVWDCADAAIKVVRGLAGGSSLTEQEKVEWARRCALEVAAKICDHQAAAWGFHQVAPSAAHACAAAIRAMKDKP